MNLFKPFTLTWWQTGMFKIGMLALGVAIGSYCATFFGSYLVPLLIIAAICLSYVTLVWARQL